MITFDNSGRLVEHMSELPDLRGARRVYIDFETRSGDPKRDSLNPWHSCDVLGAAVTVDDALGAWYLPVSHYHGKNIPREAVSDFLQKLLDGCEEWVNHNIKYDVHVGWAYLDLEARCRLVCTVVRAKLLDSDRQRKGGYGLDALSRAWLKEDINHYEEALQVHLVKNKDYGWIPPDTCGEYACQDVLTNRRLDKYLREQMPEQCAGVVETETRLTSVLVDMEQRGVRVDPSQLKLAEVQIISRLFEIDEELTDLVGRPFRPHVSGDCYDVLCCQYGLPVVEWTEEDEDTGEPAGNPSFNKHALKKYLSHPYAPREVVKRILEYRTLNQQRNLFVAPYQELHVDGIMHGSHNQVVRTGRLSMKAPNMQQLDKFAKDLILTRPGCSFLSADYSQIEFRTIVHYIKDESAIAAYLADPDTDFHQWLADAIGIQRRPAKTINFMIAFGGGKKKTLTSLETNEDVVKQIRDEVERTGGGVKEFEELCREKAEKTYRDYHDALPGIKRTSRAAAMAAEVRGYVFNLAGRRRHLPAESAHIAFNTLNQSSAADIIKERMVALHALLQGTDVHMVLSVHDELVLEGPSELMHDPRLVRDVTNVMEHPAIQLRVPLRVSYGVGDRSWLEAGSQELKLAYDPASCEGLQWLRDGAGLYSHDSALERDTSDTLA